MSDSLWPHRLQHARLPCPSPAPGAYSNSSTESVMPSNQPHPLSFPSPPAFNLSQHQDLFQWVSSSHRWPKYWSFSFSISPSNEYSGLISFRIDRLDLLVVQRTLKGLLQHHRSKAPILWRSALLILQLSHPYVTTGKTIAWTRQNFVGKVMSLLLNILSRLVIAFLPRSKLLNLMAAVTICSDFGAPPPPNKVCHCFPIYLPWSDGTRCHDLSSLNVEF